MPLQVSGCSSVGAIDWMIMSLHVSGCYLVCAADLISLQLSGCYLVRAVDWISLQLSGCYLDGVVN